MEMLFEDGRDLCHHKIRVHGYDDIWIGKYNHEAHGIQRGTNIYNSIHDFANSHYKEVFPQYSIIVNGWDQVHVKLQGKKVWMQAKLLAHQLRIRYVV